MRPASRLFQLVQLVRGRRLTTAAFLAQRLEVTVRTVYRDVAQLQRQGVPIEGEAGVGYRIGPGFELPPLMFSAEEARALVAATRLAQTWLDPAMALEAETALGKIVSVLPSDLRAGAQALALFAPDTAVDQKAGRALQTLREAIQSHSKLRLHYRDLADSTSARTVRPLGCFYWGKVWTFSAWCELRGDFRGFRVDRIESIETLDVRFQDEAGRTLADFLRQVDRGAA